MANKDMIRMYVKEFWMKNSSKLKKSFLELLKADDVIITASPSILIDGIKDMLNTTHIICSEIDLDTGKISYICFGENKAQIFQTMYPGVVIDNFYTDSFSDESMMSLSVNSFLVKGENIIPISNNKCKKRKI